MSNKNSVTDNELLKRICDGDKDATNELIIKYRGLVEHIARKYIDSPLEEDDIIQEGMIGLLAAIKSYNSEKGAKFNTYATHCINNSIKSALKKFSRLKDIPQGVIIELDEDIVKGKSLSAEDEFLANESVRALSETLYEELSKFENEVLRLHIVGCSYDDIADKLGKNQKAIDNAIQRIRKKLNGVTF